MSVLKNITKVTFTDQDLDFFKRMDLPIPTEKPAAILQTLMAFRNERKLHRRQCDFSKQTILSAYPANTKFPVYKNEIWWGDAWDPLDYAQDYNFSKPFFEQYAELQARVPREGTSIFNSENCDYNSHVRFSRNCYMSSLIYRCEDAYYSYWMADDKDCFDCHLLNGCTLCYECIDCDNCYECVYLQDCKNCLNTSFSYQLQGCTNCIGCSNLVQKKNYLFNEEVSEAEFKAFQKKLFNGSFKSFEQGKEYFKQMFKTAKHRCCHNLNCEEVIGDHLSNCKTCFYAFDGNNTENAKFSVSFATSKQIYYCYSAGWPDCEFIYNSAVTRGSTDIAFCYYIFSSSNLRYCDSMMTCNNCFGCIGLKHKQYCILNKQYSKEEYFELKERIIKEMKLNAEWGKFFPINLSTFGYNETPAQDHFPLSKEQIIANAWNYQEPDQPIAAPTTKYKIPDSISEAGEEICSAVLSCESSNKPYKLSKQELAFYKNYNLPIPRQCPETRFLSRLKRRNPFEIYQRKSSVSAEPIYSSFAPNREETVISENEYLDSLN